MHRKNQLSWLAVAGLAGALVLTGCTKKAEPEAEQLSAEQKVAEAQQQLEEAQKELAASKQQAQAPAQGSGSSSAAGKSSPAGGSGWSQGSRAQPANAPAPPPAPKVREVTLPAGTQISVRTITSLSTKTNQTGQPFEGTLHQPLEVDGVVVAERGASVKGMVADSDPGGRVKGVASIALKLTSIQAASGETLAVSTESVGKDAPKSTKKDALKVGIASGVGAAIGAIAGGGKGAAIGAGAGAAGGTGVVMATRGEPAVVPSESLLTFRLAAPVTYTEKR